LFTKFACLRQGGKGLPVATHVGNLSGSPVGQGCKAGRSGGYPRGVALLGSPVLVPVVAVGRGVGQGGVVALSVHAVASFCACPLCGSGCQISSGGGAVGARSKHRQAPCAVFLFIYHL